MIFLTVFAIPSLSRLISFRRSQKSLSTTTRTKKEKLLSVALVPLAYFPLCEYNTVRARARRRGCSVIDFTDYSDLLPYAIGQAHHKRPL